MLTFKSHKQKKFVMDSVSLDNVRLERNYSDSYEQARAEISNMVSFDHLLSVQDTNILGL